MTTETRGYVYALSNSSMPGLIKIGRSKHAGENRAKELYSGNTSAALPFVLEFECLFDNCIEAEALVHEALYCKRVNSKREFFKIEVDEAIEAILHVRAQCIGFSIHPEEYDQALVAIQYSAFVIGEDPFVLADSLIYMYPEQWAAPIIEYYEDREKKRGRNVESMLPN